MEDYFKDEKPEDILENLIDSKVVSVLKILLSEKEKQFYLKEVSEESVVPMATTYRILQRLKDLSIVDETKIGKFKVYKVSSNDRTAFLDTVIKGEKKALKRFVSNVKDMDGVLSIIMHGKESDTKCNIIIIGEDVPIEPLKELVYALKQDYNFTVSYLVVPQVQYDQMTEMGLYSGQKKVLYKK